MAYLYNIPQSTDLLSVSQGNILNNFGILGAIAGNTNTNSSLINASAGFNFLYLPVQGAAPTFVAGTANIWVQNLTATGNHELFIENDTTGAAIPITASHQAANGWGYLPTGNLVKWGSVAAAAASVLISYTVVSGGPAFNNVWQVFLTPVDTSANVNFTCGSRGGATTTSVTAYCNNFSGTTSIAYYVIGN